MTGLKYYYSSDLSLTNHMDQPTRYDTPRDVFLQLLATVTLYISAISVIALGWQYVNVLLPDPLNFYYVSITDTVRRAAASVVVAWPVFLLISWLIYRDIATNAAKAASRVRKWLVYLTLFLSAVTIMIDLITLIYRFFGGDLTTAFGLKVLAVLVVAVAVFGYYFWDLKRVNFAPALKLRLAAGGASVVLLILIVAGFLVVGSPATQRQRRFDDRRSSDLQSVQYEIINYWQQKGRLPATLADLTNSVTGYSAPVDPTTNQPYSYSTSGQLSFALCASFQQPTAALGAAAIRPIGGGVDSWEHGVGTTCFDRTIDPDLYSITDGAGSRPFPVTKID